MIIAFDVPTSVRRCLSQSYENNIVQLLNASQITLVVTFTADCTCHHLTNSLKKLKFPRKLRNSQQIWEFSNGKFCSIW